MLQEFITQNYLIIEQNVVTNNVVWDGDTTKWSPPQGSIALVQATTPAMVWFWDANIKDYVLQEEIGQGDIGFTWDGTVLTTNEPKPEPPKPAEDQPAADGLQTI